MIRPSASKLALALVGAAGLGVGWGTANVMGPATSQYGPTWEATVDALGSLPSPDLVAELRGDERRFNAMFAYQELYRRMWNAPDEAAEIRDLLEARVADPDRQLRQASAALLVDLYRRRAIGERDWPSAVIEALVEGLADDDIRGGALLANGEHALGALWEVESQRPIGALRTLLAADDGQARFAAAILLARYLPGTIETRVSDELLVHLADDSVLLNEIAAFHALLLLGEANLRDLLDRIGSLEWQQAALLQMAAARLEVDWRADSAHVDEWWRRARERQYGGGKLPVAALYLHPDASRLAARPQAPDLLTRLVRLGPARATPVQRARWAATWFWFLNPSGDGPDGHPLPGSARFAIVTRGF